MTMIARTGGATSGQATEVKDLPDGLLDVPASDRTNWRDLGNPNEPVHDRNIEQAVLTALPIAGNGTVSATWQIVAFAAGWRVKKLVDLADDVAGQREALGRVTVFNRPMRVHDVFVNKLERARTALVEGWVPTVRLFAADDTSADANLAQVETVMEAVALYHKAIYDGRDTVVAAIRAGTLTTSAQVQNHVAWP